MFGRFFKKKKTTILTYIVAAIENYDIHLLDDLTSVFFVTNFVYNIDTYNDLVLQINSKKEIIKFIETLERDLAQDNIEIFILEYLNNERYILIILDPFELYQNKRIINHFKYYDEFINGFKLVKIE